MGLDQYAFSTPEELTVRKTADGGLRIVGVQEESFYWRKHAKLQAFFEDAISHGEVEVVNKKECFNCNPIKLTLEVVQALQEMLNNNNLPKSQGGLFFGHQFQDESESEYREQDLEFCKWAEDSIQQGHHVYYDCWY